MVALTMLIFIFGAIMGSFMGAWSFRIPKGIKISNGRSFCPRCKHIIAWYDNIPIYSFFVLSGKCRNCGKKISLREPLIEISMAALFVAIFLVVINCNNNSPFCRIVDSLGIGSVPYFFIMAFFLVGIVITDLEHKLIPDEFSFILLLLGSILVIGVNYDDMFLRYLLGILSALFLLMLNIITKGKGMGLGDVKLVLFAPLILAGWQSVLLWLMLSFIIGAVVGIVFILFGKAKLGKQIPFGPFLVIAFAIVLLLPFKIISAFLPVF